MNDGHLGLSDKLVVQAASLYIGFSTGWQPVLQRGDKLKFVGHSSINPIDHVTILFINHSPFHFQRRS